MKQTSASPTMSARVAELRQRRRELFAAGGEARVAQQHQQGKLTARERLERLFDPESFLEQQRFARHRCHHFDMAAKSLPSDGVITGSGTVDGRRLFAASQDFTVAGGTAGEVHCQKIAEAMHDALKTGSPFVFINDSGGARIQEGVNSLSGYGRIFYANTLLSGVVPQISLICGPCAGGAAYSPALTDFIIQTRQAQLFVTGPAVIKQVTGETVSPETLGGADVHMTRSGVAHLIADNDQHAIELCQRLLRFLPPNNLSEPPRASDPQSLQDLPALTHLLPDNPRQTYDMHRLIEQLVDGGDFLEIQPDYAPQLMIGFGRLAGYSVGWIANNPCRQAGVLDIDAADKGARFVRFCNAFNLPIITLVDVPGFLPGVQQEYDGIIRHGAKLLFAYSAATVPKITLVVRKAYGGAYIAMGSKSLGVDRCFAWPSAEVAVMGAEGAVEILHRNALKAASDPEAERLRLIDSYRETFCNPYEAAAMGLIDDVIEPAESRRLLAMALTSLADKRELRPEKKHGLIPL